jgi:hypothetical protein
MPGLLSCSAALLMNSFMASPQYVIDTDVLVTIERAGKSSAVESLGRLPVVVTDTVWAEYGGPNPGRTAAQVASYETFLSTIAGTPTVLAPQSPEAATYLSLFDSKAKMNEGESTVIAYAAHHAGTIAVLLDKTPLHRSLEELKGRTLSLHCFLDVLVGLGLSKANADVVSKFRNKAASQKAPLWW